MLLLTVLAIYAWLPTCKNAHARSVLASRMSKVAETEPPMSGKKRFGNAIRPSSPGQRRRTGQLHAHFPSKAMMPAPSRTHMIINVKRALSRVRTGLNRKSRANSSTKPVYSKIPADMASSTPETTLAVKEPGL